MIDINDKRDRKRDVKTFGTWYNVNRFEATRIAYRLGVVDGMIRAAHNLRLIRMEQFNDGDFSSLYDYIEYIGELLEKTANRDLERVLKMMSEAPTKDIILREHHQKEPRPTEYIKRNDKSLWQYLQI